jgi:type I restriction enzyme S subunit
VNDWEIKSLGDVLQLNYGKGLSVENRIPGPIPVYGSNGVVGYHETALSSGPGIIVGRKGSAGEVHLCDGPFYPIDTTYYLTSQDAPGADLEFLYYLLKHIDLKRVKGDVGVPGLNREMAYLEPVSLPRRLSEQKAIAHTLSTVQRAIEAQERIIQTTTVLKKALMQKLFSEGLRGEPQKETEIGLVPESWEVCMTGDVAMIQSGGTPSRENLENWNRGAIPWVKTGEINYCTITDTEEKITPTGLANSSARIFPKGTLLMAMYGQGVTRGRVGLLGIEAATNQACAAIIPLDPVKTLTQFLYYFFEHSYEVLRQLGHGANQKNMSAALIRSFPLRLPGQREQQEISSILSTLDLKLTSHRKKLAINSELIITLIHELMTSKRSIHSIKSSSKNLEFI